MSGKKLLVFYVAPLRCG